MTLQDIFKSSFLENVTSFSIIDAVLAVGISFLIGLFIFLIYRKTFTGVLYSRSFNISLLAMTMVTTIIIMGVTSNVVLSLGMVGALSIVRFRTAIKDPMDTLFIFWTIAVGILCGAGFFPLAIMGSIIIGIVLLILVNKITLENPYLVVLKTSNGEAEKQSEEIIRQNIKKYSVKSKTIDPAAGGEIIYEVRLKNNNTGFVHALLNIPGVKSAALLSYDGNFAA